ncbi:hypothetical protein BRC77_09060 [Halobacteriales archaeon QH_8_64_26]|nr:MAG: hypothetical protein BRC77_09060 [Halobacteriales archaeon QH_8_64_26]
MSTADRGPVGTLRALVTEIQEKRITFLAASLAYYSFVSLIPLLLLAISIATLVGGQGLADRIINAAGGSLPPSVADIITQTLTSDGAAGASIGIGLVFLLWSAIKIFRGMDIAFSKVYGTSGPDGIVDQVTNALVTLLGIVLAVIVTIVIGAVVSFIQQSAGVLDQVGLGFLQGIIGYLAGFVSIVGLALAFYPLYYFLPTGDVTLREAIPGAVFAAVGWTVLQTGFRIYAAQSGGSAYGVIGAALLVLTFLYFGGMVLLIGVAINAVLADRTDGESLESGADDDEETGDGSEGSEERAGETDTEEGVFRRRVKERTQSIIDEREADDDPEDGSEYDPDRDRDRAATDGGAEEDRKLMTDGGVEREAERSREPGERTSARNEPAAATDTDTRTETADPDRPEAAAATGPTGSEYTLEEEYALQREIERLRTELDAFEMEVEDRVVDREDLEGDLQDYVDSRVRSSKARGWGPYLVLLYGTAMTVAIAFGNSLTGWLAVFAILVAFLSTLGLYVLMVIVGFGISTATSSKKLIDIVQSRRS